MATTTTKTKTTTKKGKGLTKKVGPFPVWAYIGVVGIVVLYLYYRHRNSSGQSSSASTGGYSQPSPASGVDVVPSGNANTTTGDTSASSAQPVDFPSDYATQTDLQNAIDSINNTTAQDIATMTFPDWHSSPQQLITPAGPNSPVSKATAASKTAAKVAHPSGPFGGIVGTRKAKNGSIITTYRSGRVIEKAPGKSAYVVHK